MGKDDLHGLAEGASQVTRNNGDKVDPTNNNKNVESSVPQPFNMNNFMDGPNLVHGDYGPTPGYPLGKRSRELRSPPSLGSLLGPSQRLFVHNQEEEHVDLDLNIPSEFNTVGEIPDLAVDGDEPPDIERCFHRDQNPEKSMQFGDAVDPPIPSNCSELWKELDATVQTSL
ncbi:hypothetical protein Hanom_Chr11g01028481 [Helianthus anomalus]